MSTLPADTALDLNFESFIQRLIRELSGTLQEVVGLEEAEGFISLAGQSLGDDINSKYRQALKVEKLSREQVALVLVDLKKRINGDFYLISESKNKIVLGNRKCPFAENVFDRPSMCMMTSNVFGIIAAENLGYGKVSIDKAIARHDPECRVTIYLGPDNSVDGREYYPE